MAQSQIMRIYNSHLKQVQKDYPQVPWVEGVPEQGETFNWLKYHAREPRDFHRIIAALRTAYGHLPDERKRKLRVLVLAGGYGQLGHLLSKEGYDACTIDLNAGTLKEGKKHQMKGGMVAADAFRLPFRQKRFDAVISDHFLKSDFFNSSYASEYPFNEARHIGGKKSEMERNAFNEVRRVAKSNAIVVLSKTVVKKAPSELIRDDYSDGARDHGRFHVQTLGSQKKMKETIIRRNRENAGRRASTIEKMLERITAFFPS